MSIASGYGPKRWTTTVESRGLDAQRRIAELEQQLAAVQAEVRELRSGLVRVRELAAKWRAAPQNPEEPLLAMAADELEAVQNESLTLMARRPWMRRDTNYFVVHGDFCLEIKALDRAPYFDESGELVVVGDSAVCDQVDAEAQPDGIYRIADTDEHGFKVIPRTADMPERAKYRLTYTTQKRVYYISIPQLALEANLSGAMSERIEDYRPAAQEEDDA